MNRKHKTKHKQNKQTNPVPTQESKEEIVVAEKDIEERVPEITPEVIELPVTNIQSDNVDTPKKPKRNRGKKRSQEPDIENDKQDEIKEETKSANPTEECDLEIKIEAADKVLIPVSESEQVVPKSRTKKGKNKKAEEKILEEFNKQCILSKSTCSENVTDEENIAKVVSNEFEIQSDMETQQPEMTLKKKNKNKKNKKNMRDSEKSDIECITKERTVKDESLLNEELLPSKEIYECNVEDSNVATKSSDIGKVVDVNKVKEDDKFRHVETALQTLDEPTRRDNTKGKKKNKKNRTDSEISDNMNNIKCDELHKEQPETLKNELLSDSTENKTLKVDLVTEPILTETEPGKNIEMGNVAGAIEDPIVEILSSDNNESKDGFKEVTKSKKKSKKDKQPHVSNISEIAYEEKSATNKEAQEDNKDKFFVEPSHSGQKHESTINEGKVSVGIVQSDLKPIVTQELNSQSEFTPDTIEYPRSLSEQSNIDNNNNTIISEVRSENLLNVSFKIPDTPLIQGLDIDNNSQEVTINFTNEPIDNRFDNKSQPFLEEKCNLKSKVVEVNQDMEELRLSIEKSLAELTALENTQQIPELISVVETVQDTKLESPIGTNTEKENNKLISQTLETQCDFVEQEKSEHVAAELSTEIIKSDTSKVLQSGITPSENVKCSTKKEQKGKGKSKKKSKQDAMLSNPCSSTTCSDNIVTETTSSTTDTKSSETECKKTDNKTSTSENSKKKQESGDSNAAQNDGDSIICNNENESSHAFNLIENFEDVMTSSVDDVNRSFELIANEVLSTDESKQPSPEEQIKKEEPQVKENPIVSRPKNLLGHPDIPVQSSKTDYKKEKNKTPNTKQARVKIKDGIEPEQTRKLSKHSQTENKAKIVITKLDKQYTNNNEEYIYKYSFRKVFLPHCCHVCKKEFKSLRFPCTYCNLVFYCSQKHKDEDWVQHQGFCFAVSTIVHLKGQKYIYADAKDIIGLSYRLHRMQVIISCEKVLKRRLVPWEQEALLYPRICAEPSCREWIQNRLTDCEGCRQIAYCKENTNHLPKQHLRWCKSYNLYQKLVIYQQTKGRLEPKLPTRIINDIDFELPDKINELLAVLYEEKIDLDDTMYAALTQLATAPLTAVYCHQIYTNKMNSIYANGIHKKPSFTLHVVGAELQFEADTLNKWEIFFLHLRPDVKELKVVLIGPELNISNLPLDILGKIKLCENCRQNKRKVIFNFHDKELYHDYAKSYDFTVPDIVCAFNPSLNRAVGFNGKNSWPATINSILKLRTPFCVTAYTPDELPKDLAKIKECAAMDFKIISEPSHNPYASVRPDRNFISDDEMPLLFKNYSYMVLCGMF